MARKKGTDWDSVPLGQVSDGEIARSLGVVRSSVTLARQKRSIAPHQEAYRSPIWIDWAAQPLGEVGDAEIARRLGCTRAAVGKARGKRGIPRVKTAQELEREREEAEYG